MKPGWTVCWIVDKFHVATPYEEIAEDISERARLYDTEGKVTPRLRSRFITQAVIRHRQNRRLYSDVMNGRIG
jgi:hypothetical protein